MTRHMLGLFSAVRGARAWRRSLTVEAMRPGAGAEVIERALAGVVAASDEAEAAQPVAGSPALAPVR
jgi:tRNA-dihydrouridine synthase A